MSSVQCGNRGRRPRPRKFLIPQEADAVVAAASEGRHGIRDRAMCITMLEHGLRVSELIGAFVSDFNLDAEEPFYMIRGVKGADKPIPHPIGSVELKALRRWLAIRPRGYQEMFLSERNGGEPFKRQAINYLVEAWGERAAIPWPVNPHALRHTCAYNGINKPNGSKDLLLLQRYMRHKSINSTLEYVDLAPGRFKELIWGYGRE